MVATFKPAQPQYQQPAYQPQSYQQPYQQPQPQYQPQYQQPQYQPQPAPYVADEDNAPVTKIGSYIGWFFLSAFSFLIIPFIIMIVFACDSSNKNRANFFRAQFAIMGIAIGLSLVLGIILAIAGVSLGGLMMGF